jgi:tape measure domain-containing protein
MNKNQVKIEVIAEDLATKVLDKVSKALEETGKSADKVSKSTQAGGTSFLSMSSAMFVANQASALVTKGFEFVNNIISEVINKTKELATNFIQLGINTSASVETARQGFVTLLGSGEAADKTIARLKLEAKRTPFEFVGLTQGVQLLSSVTKDGDKATDIILDIGEALSAMGKGQVELDRIVVNLQQIASSGRATAIDIRQFAFAGIPIFEMLQEQTGLAGEALAKFTEDGGVTFDLLTTMFDKANDKGGRFFEAFKNQGGTFNQLMSNMKDTISQTASEFVNQTGLFSLFKKGIEFATNAVNSFLPKILEFVNIFKGGFAKGFDMSAITTSLDILKRNLGGVFELIGGNDLETSGLSTFAEKIGKFSSDNLPKFIDLITKGVRSVHEFIENFDFNKIGQFIEKLKNGFANIKAIFMEVLGSQEAKNLMETYKERFKSLVNIFNTVREAFGKEKGEGGDIVSTISGIIKFLIRLGDIGQKPLNMLINTLEFAVTGFLNVRSFMVEKVIPTFIKFKDTIVAIPGKISEFVNNTVNKFIELKNKVTTTITEFVTNAVNKFIDLRNRVWQAINQLVTINGVGWLEFFKQKFDGIVSLAIYFKDLMVMKFNEIRDNVTNAIGTMVSAIRTKVEEIVGKFIEVKDRVAGVVSSMVSFVAMKAGEFVTPFVEKFNTIKNTVTNVIDVIKEKFKSFFSGGAEVGGSLANTFKSVLNVMIDKINRALEFEFSVAGANIKVNLPDIPKFAKGGDFIVPPGYNKDNFLMGVQSGEHVQVTPANQVSNNNNSKIIININGNNMNPQAIAQEVQKIIARNNNSASFGLRPALAG